MISWMEYSAISVAGSETVEYAIDMLQQCGYSVTLLDNPPETKGNVFPRQTDMSACSGVWDWVFGVSRTYDWKTWQSNA